MPRWARSSSPRPSSTPTCPRSDVLASPAAPRNEGVRLLTYSSETHQVSTGEMANMRLTFFGCAIPRKGPWVASSLQAGDDGESSPLRLVARLSSRPEARRP